MKILDPREEYVFDYQYCVDLADQQNEHYWTHKTVDVEKDVQDLRVNLTPSESYGTTEGLKIFTHYELKIGNEFWGNFVKKMFPRPDVETMADCFAFFETNIHARFYNEINKALYLDTPEFFNSYKENPVLSERMDFIDRTLDVDPVNAPLEDRLVALGTFSMLEGAVLYSNFAFFKHFQAPNLNKNKLKNLNQGIDYSVRDEHLHHLGGAYLFRTVIEEYKDVIDVDVVYKRIEENAEYLLDHEKQINRLLNPNDNIFGYTLKDADQFVEHRITLCMANLGLPITVADAGAVGEWFYNSITSIAYADNFAGKSNSYKRNWSASKLAGAWEG